MKYRADIDGLRAIAVVSVCIYHAFPAWLNGGFIGVDIFFVISGFLITSIISHNLKENRFSIIEFYAKRIRRIFPSLLLVFMAALLMGWHLLLDDEYYTLIKHIIAGSLFGSNFMLWSESGYFDSSATAKPLLHLWSLAIEEQFYIIWPLLLVLLARWNKNAAAPVAALILASFALNIGFSYQDQTTAFYLPLSRFWEIAAGGLVAIFMRHRPALPAALASLFSTAGCALFLVALFCIRETSVFPGYWALAPVAAACLVIMAGPSAWPNRALLANKPMVFMGLISFPLYLWHWLFISLLHIVVSQPTPGMMAIALLMSLLCALVSYLWVEKPIRHLKYPGTPAALLTSMALITVVGLYTYTQDALPARPIMLSNSHLQSGFDGGLAGHDVTYQCDEVGADFNFPGAKCIAERGAPPRFALIGDSKADVLAPGLIRTSSPADSWLFIGGNAFDGAPVPVLSDNPAYQRHQAFAQATLDYLSANEHLDAIVVAVATRSLFNLSTDRHIQELPESPYYAAALAGMKRGLSALISSGKQVILLVDNPTLPPPESCLQRRTASEWLNNMLNLDDKNHGCSIALKEHRALSEQYRRLLEELRLSAPEQVQVLNTLPILCDQALGQCATFKDGRALYSFTDHISDYAAGLIGQELNALLQTQDNQPQSAPDLRH